MDDFRKQLQLIPFCSSSASHQDLSCLTRYTLSDLAFHLLFHDKLPSSCVDDVPILSSSPSCAPCPIPLFLPQAMGVQTWQHLSTCSLIRPACPQVKSSYKSNLLCLLHSNKTHNRTSSSPVLALIQACSLNLPPCSSKLSLLCDTPSSEAFLWARQHHD